MVSRHFPSRIDYGDPFSFKALTCQRSGALLSRRPLQWISGNSWSLYFPSNVPPQIHSYPSAVEPMLHPSWNRRALFGPHWFHSGAANHNSYRYYQSCTLGKYCTQCRLHQLGLIRVGRACNDIVTLIGNVTIIETSHFETSNNFACNFASQHLHFCFALRLRKPIFLLFCSRWP